MTLQELQQRLNQPYSTDNWKQVVTEVFPNVQLFDPVLTIPVENSKVESFRQLGNVRLQDGKSLALFELKLKSNVNILRNRVELNNLVSQYIDQEQNHGVLSIFEQGGEDYRFTFSAKATRYEEEEADFVTKKTDTKRFTYLLGKNESCKTPALRLHDLSTKKGQADIHTIQDAFSVEKLSKEFFAEYKVHYTRMVNYLIEIPSYRVALFKGEDKAIRDFVKLTLGRLVFIQFLQKKRWMGVPASEAGWDSGDPYFLKHSFQNFEAKEVFYSNFLEPLFLEALNQDGRPNQVFALTGTKVPYLNGGLFEKGKENFHLINFPSAFFEELLEFFDRYNFTIDESDPKEQEVGIDPEMLGHIFENLLEDNKDKGAFYTPKEIVHYMCQESLLEYLKTFLEEAGKWPTSDAEQLQLEEDLSNLIKKKDVAGIFDYTRELAIALRDVKICDPAIGSGAFPMGLLAEIFYTVYLLFQATPAVVGEEWGMEEWKPNVVKKNIIQNSIYGVDIEKGAIDIARLRFWLSLIVDEPEPEALPNLDYKIVVGNSLISKLGDTVIDIDWSLDNTSHGLFGADLAQRKGELLKKISAKQKEFFNPESDKRTLAADIRNLKIDLLINQLELMVRTKGIETQPTGNSKKILFQTELYLKTLDWKESINQLKNLSTNPEKKFPFFDWKLDFPELLNELVVENPGFDILIGNPPYISYYGNTGSNLSQEIKNYLVKNFESVTKTNDRINSMNLFTEKAIQLLKQNGNLSFIVNKTMSVLPSYLHFRKYILNNVTFKYSVIDLTPFEAIVDCLIFSIKKEIPPSNYSFKYYNGNIENYSIKPISIFNNNLKKEFHIPNDISILEKIEQAPKRLNEILIINRGVNIGGCFEFFLNLEKINDNYFKYLPGTKCIKPYEWKWTSDDGFMNFDVNEEKKLRKKGKTIALGNRNRYTQPKLFIPESSQSIMSAYVEDVVYSAYGLLVGTTELGENYLKFTCGLLNSKLVTFYSIQREILRKGNKATPHVGVKGLNSLPIYSEDEYVKYMSKLVDKIIILKTKGHSSHIEENEIDLIVYKMYGLNFIDVKIIDPEFSLSEEEYMAILLD